MTSNPQVLGAQLLVVLENKLMFAHNTRTCLKKQGSS